MIIANLALWASLAIYHLTSSANSWNNFLLNDPIFNGDPVLYRHWPKSRFFSPYLMQRSSLQLTFNTSIKWTLKLSILSRETCIRRKASVRNLSSFSFTIAVRDYIISLKPFSGNKVLSHQPKEPRFTQRLPDYQSAPVGIEQLVFVNLIKLQ